ncbi:MAG: hypothetical protein E7530_03790 [Ruminococcaceae bacterium]|nr:hypothetical protein [Oscillospiraceae bacterium]
MAEDLYVCDVDYDVLACKVQDYWEKEDEILKKLISILSKVAEHGIAKGDAHNSIVILKEEIEAIYETTQGQGAVVSQTALEFLSRIDEIDLKLYGQAGG